MGKHNLYLLPQSFFKYISWKQKQKKKKKKKKKKDLKTAKLWQYTK